MSVRKRIEKYRRSGGAADLVRVEVLVPSSARDDVLRLAERLRADHRNEKDLQVLLDQALSLYRVRILDNVDLDRLPNLRARASVIAKAMIERGDARAFALGRELLSHVERMSEVAEKDIADLEKEGFRVTVDVKTYGTYEATVSDDSSSTVIQWMSDTRIRFFPLVKDEQWGLRLHQADLAVNKVLAASSRRKARDFADIVAISANMCPIGPLVMAAAGKPPAYSPQKIIEQMRWHAQTISDNEYSAVKGLPADWTPQFIRAEVTRQMDLAETYIMSAPVAVVGVLSVDADGTPVEVTSDTIKAAVLRKATEEPDVMPMPAEFSTTPWSGR